MGQAKVQLVQESSETNVGFSRPRLEFQKSEGGDGDYNLQSLYVETKIETEILKVSNQD